MNFKFYTNEREREKKGVKSPERDNEFHCAVERTRGKCVCVGGGGVKTEEEGNMR